jgi:hypothetical protein
MTPGHSIDPANPSENVVGQQNFSWIPEAKCERGAISIETDFGGHCIKSLA